MMHAEIISVGDELTSGQCLDTNGQWLSCRLGEMGIRTLYHTTVGDEMTALVDVFQNALKRADLIIATGGIGPTADDLTRQAIAEALDVPLELNQQQLDGISAMFERRGYKMPAANQIQAMFPVGSKPIDNPHGTAPGIHVQQQVQNSRNDQSHCELFSLPGVPAEMKQMWHESIAPYLLQNYGGGDVIRHRRIKCFGIGESFLESKLPDLIRRGRDPEVGITVHEATITLRISTSGNTEADCDSKIQSTVDTIYESLENLVFGEGDDELQHVVGKILLQQKKNIATVEWGTGGTLARWFGELPDSNLFFRGSLIPHCPEYFDDVLQLELTELNGESAKDQEAYWKNVALQSAKLCREKFSTDYALSVILPQDRLEDHPTNQFWVALADRESCKSRSLPLGGHPNIQQPRSCKHALNMLRLNLS